MFTQSIKRHARQAKQDLRSILARPGHVTFNYVRRVMNVYNRAAAFCSGKGLKVGALSMPFRFTDAQVQDADERDMRILDAIPIEKAAPSGRKDNVSLDPAHARP